jgi:hypothetical protein
LRRGAFFFCRRGERGSDRGFIHLTSLCVAHWYDAVQNRVLTTTAFSVPSASIPLPLGAVRRCLLAACCSCSVGVVLTHKHARKDVPGPGRAEAKYKARCSSSGLGFTFRGAAHCRSRFIEFASSARVPGLALPTPAPEAPRPSLQNRADGPTSGKQCSKKRISSAYTPRISG